MSYIFYNPNPAGNLVGDCVIRSISKATGKTWDESFADLMATAYELKDMPTVNYVWTAYLKHNGFVGYMIPDTCPDCYTVRDFAMDHPYGTYILGTGSHAVAVCDGDYYDSWDSGDEVPIFYFKRERY